MKSIVKDKLWPALKYEPHNIQRAVHNAPARHRVMDAGRRTGKSKMGGHELVPYALQAHMTAAMLESEGIQRRYWIVGPNYDDGEREWRVFYDSMKRLKVPFDRPGTYNDSRGGNMAMSLWGGRFIAEVRSADHEESLDGEGLDGVLLVEAAKMKRAVWDKFIRAALADKRGWSLQTSTPEGRNWFYDHWVSGQDPDKPDWYSIKAPSWSNTAVFPGGRQDSEILALEADMSPEKFRQEIGAEFTDFVGRVFKDFDEQIHVKNLQYDPKLPLYGATDYGWTNPFVWLAIQVDVWDNVYILGEYRRTEKDVNDIARDLMAWPLARGAQRFYPEPASPGDTAILTKALRVPAHSKTGGELKWRLELIRQHLKLRPDHIPIEQRKPKLYIDRGCTDLIREMSEYRYPETKSEVRSSTENPMDKDDHGPEALGRFMRGYFGSPGDAAGGRARVSRVNIGRR